MKIIDGLKIKGAPAEIPDCGRDDLPQFFVDMGYKVGAEIGTSKGGYAERFGKAGLKLYCIDPWLAYGDYYGGKEEHQRRFNQQYIDTKALLAPYDFVILKKTSMEALADIPDGSLDFVYIDGNHDFMYVAEDLFMWSKKVRKGGIISGHDYFYSQDRIYDSIHVKYVVDAYVKAFKINQWYIVGRKEKREGEARDAFRSFFWIKS
ncbi:MAG: class I SAM-dependent methyltransferase [Candidatus Paceibacterota bacterium]